MNTQKREEGIVHLFVIVIVVVIVIGVLGYGAWRLATNNSNTPHVATNTAVQNTCNATYHDNNLCQFAGHTDIGKLAYSATLKVTNSDGTTNTTTLQSDGKGNTSLTGVSGDGTKVNSIELNGATYIQANGSGPWIKYAAGSGQQQTQSPTSNMDITVGANGVTFKNLGTEACGSLTCYKYEVDTAATPNAKQYVWFDNSSYLLRRWQYTDNNATTDMTLNYQSVTISQPSPVQDFSASTTGQ